MLNREYYKELNFQIDEYLYGNYFFWITWDIFLAVIFHDLLDRNKFCILDDSLLIKYNILVSIILTFAISKRTKLYHCLIINNFSLCLSYLGSFGVMCLMMSGILQYINVSCDNSTLTQVNRQKQYISIDNEKALFNYTDTEGIKYPVYKLLSNEELANFKDAQYVDVEFVIHPGFLGFKWIDTVRVSFDKTIGPR